MNTSHNKNRIIEHGWKNIFKNIIGKPNSSISTDSDTNESSENVLTVKMGMYGGKQKKKKVVTADMFVTKSSRSSYNNYECTSDQFQHGINDDEKPSSSKGQGDETENGSSSTVLKVRGLNQVKNQKLSSKQLVQGMLDASDDEEKYLQTFRYFVIFVNYCNEGNDPDEFRLHNDILHNQAASINSVSKTITVKGKCSTSRNKNSKSKGKRKNTDNDQNFNSSSEDKNMLKGDKEERMSSRRELLFQIRSCKENTEPFHSLSERLIDLEESFIS